MYLPLPTLLLFSAIKLLSQCLFNSIIWPQPIKLVPTKHLSHHEASDQFLPITRSGTHQQDYSGQDSFQEEVTRNPSRQVGMGLSTIIQYKVIYVYIDQMQIEILFAHTKLFVMILSNEKFSRCSLILFALVIHCKYSPLNQTEDH